MMRKFSHKTFLSAQKSQAPVLVQEGETDFLSAFESLNRKVYAGKDFQHSQDQGQSCLSINLGISINFNNQNQRKPWH